MSRFKLGGDFSQVALMGEQVSSELLLQKLLNDLTIKQVEQDDDFPPYAIVRKIIHVKAGETNLQSSGFFFDFTINDEDHVLMLVELPGVTEKYGDIFRDDDNKISEDEFVSSLVPIYVNSSALEKIPSENSVVEIGYEDPNDPFNIFFKGFPTKNIDDPYLKLTLKEDNSRSSFPQGAPE